jgi:hypothetical protein
VFQVVCDRKEDDVLGEGPGAVAEASCEQEDEAGVVDSGRSRRDDEAFAWERDGIGEEDPFGPVFPCFPEEMRYLAHTMCWPVTVEVDDALGRWRRAMMEVSGIRCEGRGS